MRGHAATTAVISDGELVRLASAGDRAAFERLIEARLDRAFRTACGILGNEADARDATQDAFVSAWRNLPRLRDIGRLDAWLQRLLVNACRDVLRRQRRSREIALDDFERSVPDAQREVAERAAFNAAFDRLGVDDRALLVMHHLEDVALSEIASQLRIPLGTAKWRLHRARRALERALEAES